MNQIIRPEEVLAEYYPPLTDHEAAVEANRCLYCYDAPCTHACPTHIDIPRFINEDRHRECGGLGPHYPRGQPHGRDLRPGVPCAEAVRGRLCAQRRG